MSEIHTENYAQTLDSNDPLAAYKNNFYIPQHNGNDCIYFCGNSLGLQPRTVEQYIKTELDDWRIYGVDGHLNATNPWLPYHEFVQPALSAIVGAKATEVVAMNSLTVNLHLLMGTFYKPTNNRHKIMIESSSFPSDRYAMVSWLQRFGYDETSLVEVGGDGSLITDEVWQAAFAAHGSTTAVVLVGGVNYYSGQYFDLPGLVKLGHSNGCIVGFDLAHAAGNVPLQLHNWDVDFAAWCSYKYLNAGPGAIAGAFIHERHATNTTLQRFAGWWGHDKSTRFNMPKNFSAIPTAEAWQLSNPPVFQLAALRASLDIFHAVGMEALRKKSELLTGYLIQLLTEMPLPGITILTPQDVNRRGCQCSLRTDWRGKKLFDYLTANGVVCDWRHPDVIRVAPVPLYNTFADILGFYTALANGLSAIG